MTGDILCAGGQGMSIRRESLEEALAIVT